MAFLNKPQRTILNPKRYRYKHIERCGAKSISLDNWRALIDLTGSEAAALDVRYVLMRLRATAHSSGFTTCQINQCAPIVQTNRLCAASFNVFIAIAFRV
jgi:hypothetical protein